jgi:hypothetical protein
MRSLLRGPITQLALLFAVAAAALAALAVHVRDWVVMTDEMQYAKLATAFGHGDVLPTLRGVHVSAYAQLYPALLSPFYSTLSAPTAFHVAHVVNGILFAAAAVPAFFLAREVGLSQRWSLVGAALCIAVPWNMLAGFVMSESAAYPAFMLAMLASQRALTKPSPRRDLLAIGAIAIAVLARTQFLVLGVTLPLAALLVTRRRVLARHRVLAVAVAGAAIVGAVLRGRVLGSYSVAAHGSIISWKMFEQAGAHLDVIGLAVGLLPLLLGGAWIVDGAWRREPFAVLALVTIAAVTLEASSFDARFGGGLSGIRGRYVFYSAPLLLLAMLLLLARRRMPRLALAGATAFVAVTIYAHDFLHVAGVYVDAPEAVANDVIRGSGGAPFVALLTIVLAVVMARLPFRYLTPIALVVVATITLTTTATAWERLLTGKSPSGRLVAHPPDLVYDWIDRALPSGAQVAMLPYALYSDWGSSAILWWDVEFWNHDVVRSYVIHGEWEYAPFPNREVRVDPDTGVIAGTANASPYLVTAVSDARVHVIGERVAFNYGLDVRAVQRPWRAEWMTTGLDEDGWSRVGRAAAVHVFAPRGVRVRVNVHLATPDNRVSVASVNDVCVPPNTGSADIPIPAGRKGVAVPLPLGPGRQKGPRHDVGRRVIGIDVVPSGRSCA